MPEEKVQSIENLQAANHKVCMIGDGVNDAPALKTADVSVAMGNMGSINTYNRGTSTQCWFLLCCSNCCTAL